MIDIKVLVDEWDLLVQIEVIFFLLDFLCSFDTGSSAFDGFSTPPS